MTDSTAFKILKSYSTSFADLTQSILSKLAPGIEYVVGLLADNPAVLTGAFAALAASLLRLVIPAMGSFTIAIANNAAEAKTAAAEQKAALEDRVLKSQQANISSLELQKTELKGAVLSAKTSQSYKGRGEALKQANSQLAKAVGNEEKIAALENKSAVLNKSRRKSNAAAIDKEQAAIANEIKQRKEILKVDQQIQQARNNPASQAGPGSKANLDMQKALRKEITSTGLANVAATAETLGFKTAMGSLTTQLNIAKTSAKQAGVSFGFLRQGLFMVSGAAVARAAASWSSTLMPCPVAVSPPVAGAVAEGVVPTGAGASTVPAPTGAVAMPVEGVGAPVIADCRAEL